MKAINSWLNVALLSMLTGHAIAEVHFDRHEVVIGTEERQTVVPGFFLCGDIAELAVAYLDEEARTHLRFYSFSDGEWALGLEAVLPPGLTFVDVANIDGRDRLITYRSGQLNWFDIDSLTERELLRIDATYNATASGLHYANVEGPGPVDEGEIPRVDITRDLNGDGRDDLVVPDLDGFWIALQRSDGGFSGAVKLGPPEPYRNAVAFDDTRSYGEVGITPLTIPWFLSRIHQMDYDQDGHGDLVFWNEDHFEVYRQDARGRFSASPDKFTVDVPFDADGNYTHIFGFGDASTFSLLTGFRKKTRRTVLQAVRDMNGDGVADMVTHTLEGRSVLRLRSRYDVYFGTPTADGIVFARDVSAALYPQGKAGGVEAGGYSSLWLEDFDGDGEVDILRGDIQIGVGAIVRAMLGTTISIRAELFRMENGTYPGKATTSRKMKSDIDISDGRDGGFFPAVLVGDVNGDGSSDVLVGKNREELHVFLGGTELLVQQPQKVAVTLPGDERNSWLTDLDKDGKQDVLMHHPSATEAHRVTILMARQLRY